MLGVPALGRAHRKQTSSKKQEKIRLEKGSMKRILILGVGAFAHSMASILKQAGAEVECYLTRDYGHHGVSTVVPTWDYRDHPSFLSVLKNFSPDAVIPMSIDWHHADWAASFIEQKIPILCAKGPAFPIEGTRQFAAELCQKYQIPFPQSYTFSNRQHAIEWVHQHPVPYVIKNPHCSPGSPIRAIVCRLPEETLGCLEQIDDSDGVFLQEYMGEKEAGHFVFVSGGEVVSLATNLEFKQAFDGDMGPMAGAPLGGMLEQDPLDRHGLAKALVHPLQPWFKETNFHGPLQVSAIKRDGVWHVIEYNIRLGVTSGAMILRMLANPVETLIEVASNRPARPRWIPDKRYGVSVSVAGYGYPYFVPEVPKLPVTLQGAVDCDLWWNEVRSEKNKLYGEYHYGVTMGHRLVDIVSVEEKLETAVRKVYENLPKVQSLGSYYRTDINQTKWLRIFG